MKEEMNKSPEEIFRMGFENHEMPFDPLAWGEMRKLLEEQEDMKPVVLLTDQRKDKRRFFKLFTIMSTLVMITASLVMLTNGGYFGKNSGTEKDLLHTQVATHSKNTNEALDNETKNSESIQLETKANTTAGNNQSVSGFTSDASPSKTKSASKEHPSSSSKKWLQTGQSIVEQAATGVSDPVSENPVADAVAKGKTDSSYTYTSNGKTYRVMTRNIWVDNQYTYKENTTIKPIGQGFIGVHFTGQNAYSYDSSAMTAGFNLQFMSGNRLKDPHWGAYGGFDFGMQFYGHGPKSNVVLNNTSQDSGYTRLNTVSFDFLGRGHLEYARFPLIPYINVMGGPRLYSTNQKVASYLPLKNTESSSSTNAHTSVSMVYGVGLGVRLRVSPVVSLDFRYEWMNGTRVKVADMRKSTFNGLSYDLKYKNITPRSDLFKVGVLFDISEREYDKEIVKEGYWKQIGRDTLFLETSDTSRIIVPCNCQPCNTRESVNSEDATHPQNATPTYEEAKNQNRWNSGSNNNNNNGGNSGSGKGAFPGIKPSSRPTEKRIY